jgi:hypothetical protein
MRGTESGVGYEGDEAERLEQLVDEIEATFAGLAQAFDRSDLRGGYQRWRGDEADPSGVIRRPTGTRAPRTAIVGACAWCGRALPRRTGRGRPSQYCSGRCRADAENASKRARRAGTQANVVSIAVVPSPLDRALAITGRPWAKLTNDERSALWLRDPAAGLALYEASNPVRRGPTVAFREAA